MAWCAGHGLEARACGRDRQHRAAPAPGRGTRAARSPGMKPWIWFALLAGAACGGSGGGGGGDAEDVFDGSVTRVVIEIDYETGQAPFTGPIPGFGDTFDLLVENVDRLF